MATATLRLEKVGSGTYYFVEAAANSAGIHNFYAFSSTTSQYLSAKLQFTGETHRTPAGTDVYINSITTELGFYNASYTTTLNSDRAIQFTVSDGTNTTVYSKSLSGETCNKTARAKSFTCSIASGNGIFKSGVDLNVTIKVTGAIQRESDRVGCTCYSDTDERLYTTLSSTGRVYWYYRPDSYSSPQTVYTDAKSYNVAATTRAATYSRTGYTQTAWSFSSGGARAWYCNASVGAGDVTVDRNLYPVWSANQYVLTIKYQDGSSDFVTDGSSTKPHLVYGTQNWINIGARTRTGYTLTGYYSAPSGGTKIYDASGYRVAGTSYWNSSGNYCYTGNMTVYAQWTANSYTVTFNANGGVTPTASKSVTYDSTYDTLPTPTRQGYTFNGWYTATSGGTQITSSSTVSITAAQTLYAQWTANTYTVTFNANGGSVSDTSLTVTYGSTYDSLPIPTKPGYRFKGWYVNFDGSNFVNYGADYKYADKLNVHLTAYMDNWANFQDNRLISCTETGGWNIETWDGFLNFAAYSAADSDYKRATSPVEPAFLEPGWHNFDFVFSGMGESIQGYIDGELVATSEPLSGVIGYNTLNSIFLGAESSNTQTVPDEEMPYFIGKIGNVIISNEDTVYPINTYDKMTVPAQDITLYAEWEQTSFMVHFDSNGGTSNDLTSLSQEFEYSVDTPLSIPDPYNFNIFSFGKTPITEAEWNTQPDGSGITIGINDTISSLSLQSLAEENGDTLTFYINWRPAGKACIFTSNTNKVFAYPWYFDGRAWTKCMVYIYDENSGRWLATVEPLGSLENYQIIYPNEINIYAKSDSDEFYPTI